MLPAPSVRRERSCGHRLLRRPKPLIGCDRGKKRLDKWSELDNMPPRVPWQLERTPVASGRRLYFDVLISASFGSLNLNQMMSYRSSSVFSIPRLLSNLPKSPRHFSAAFIAVSLMNLTGQGQADSPLMITEFLTSCS